MSDIAKLVTPEAWLVTHKQTKKRRVIDAAKHDPSSLAFWISPEAADMHSIVPLYSPEIPDPEALARWREKAVQAEREACAEIIDQRAAFYEAKRAAKECDIDMYLTLEHTIEAHRYAADTIRARKGGAA